MKIKQFLLYCCLFAVLFCSCNLLIEIGGGDSGGVSNPTNVPPRKFWAQNVETNGFYQLDAELLAQSKNCSVWVEKGSGVTVAMATSMAKAYEDTILPKMLDTYGIVYDFIYGGKVVAHNIMELADWYGDRDGKLCILLLDIKDGYNGNTNMSYVGGYFWGGNFLNDQYSNLCDMIYIDTYPGKPGTVDSNATFAHEMQHMMNLITTQITRSNLMDLWIDEGLATTAEWLISGSHPEYRWAWYNQDPSGLIKRGNNFFVWGNRENESQYAVLDDYATAYLFFQWLRLQAGKTDIYYDIITSRDFDYRAVTSAADKYMTGNNYTDWGTLLKTWMAANYINASSGPYGYKNDSVLKGIKANTAPKGITNISLSPGEGVYSVTNNYNMPGNKQSVRYAGLDKSGKVSDTATFSGGAMLTYNTNTDADGRTESGTTTGVASYVEADVDMDATERSVMGVSFSGPYAIGAWDMLRQNGFERPSSLELPNLTKGIAILE